MNPLLIESTEFSPKVILDATKKKFEISGESRPENAGKFYAPIIKWFEDYRKVRLAEKEKFGSLDKMVVEFKFIYFNSTSTKYIMDILKQFDTYYSQGDPLEIRWYFEKDDEDMKESGEEFAKLVNIPLKFVELENNTA